MCRHKFRPTSLIRNQLWTTAKCAVLRSQTIDLDGYYKITRLVGKIAVLGCQPAVGICAEEAVGEFSCGYVCKKCFDAVIKYQAKKKAFVALEKDLLGKLSAKTMQSGEGRGVKRPRVSDSAYEYDEKPSVASLACAHA